MSDVYVAELFESIQGESTYAGMACFFVRLAGCNLACTYCDTPAAREEGRPMAIEDIVAACVASVAPLIEITGGEPMQQQGFEALVTAIRAACDKRVLVETNGTCDISRIPDGVVAVVDVKTPGSGMAGTFDESNLARLRPGDEVKFVLCDRADYDWAKEQMAEYRLDRFELLLSPASGLLNPRQLAEWMKEDVLQARLNIQLHRVIWPEGEPR